MMKIQTIFKNVSMYSEKQIEDFKIKIYKAQNKNTINRGSVFVRWHQNS